MVVIKQNGQDLSRASNTLSPWANWPSPGWREIEIMFDEDKKEAQHWENLALKWIKQKYPQAYHIDGDFNSCDIIVPEIGKRVEVKYDRMSDETGNIAIEKENTDGSPSGITISKADFWIWAIDKHLYKINKTQLRNLAWNRKYRTVAGGDGLKKRLVLVPKEDFIRYCECIC